MKVSKLIFKLFLLSIVFVSCTDDNTIEEVDFNPFDFSTIGDYFIVTGEGSGAGSGNVSIISDDLSVVENNVYSRNNKGVELGTFFQSMAFGNSNKYLIVDNANTINVLNSYNYKKEATISEGLATPRYMAISGDKGYVTNWGTTTAFLAIVDLESNKVTNTINIGAGPERVIVEGDKIYVSHKGGFGSNNIITVIDKTTETVSTTITVLDKPDEIFIHDGDLVVLSEGLQKWAQDEDGNWFIEKETKAAIQRIDLSNNTVVETISFVDGQHPSLLDIDKQTGDLYYALSSKVYKLNNGSNTLPSSEEFTQSLYGMNIINGKLYGVNASFTSQSDFVVYDLANN